MAADYVQVTSTAGASNNIVYPWPWQPVNPYWTQYDNFTWTRPSPDSDRIAALEARLAKLERQNRRLKRGLGRLYAERKAREKDGQ